MEREIIIFAKSIKHGGFCVAGKCTQTGEWIRPVSNEQGGAITDNQAKATNPNWIRKNKAPYPIKLLHKIQMDFSRPVPFLHQQENWLNNPNYIWQHNFSVPATQLNGYLDNHSNLWMYGYYQDKVNANDIRFINNSLYLISVSNLEIYTTRYNERDRTRARFEYNQQNYDFVVTDPNFMNCDRKYQQAIICVSLGEIYNNNYYKLVASIFV